MPPAKMKRYQNISTMNTSVLRARPGNEPLSIGLKPRGIVELSKEDVELTKDRCQPRESNPFDTGLVAEIPAGQKNHPDAPAASVRFVASDVQRVMVDGSLDELEEMLNRAQDTGHVALFDRAYQNSVKGMPEARANDIDQLITERRQQIAEDTRKRGRELDAKLRQPV